MRELAVVYTIGHSTRSIEDFIATLCAAGITTLVDIRSLPGSRHATHFNEDALAPALREVGITYVRSPELGGRRGRSKVTAPQLNGAWRHPAFHNYADYALTPAFEAGLKELIRLARKKRCAIMCAEALWWRCHRRIVTDHLLAHGILVVHLFSANAAEEAALTPFAVVGKDAQVSYPIQG